MPRPPVVLAVITALALGLPALLGASGCRSRSGTREWRPDDHDEEKSPTQVAPPTGSGGVPEKPLPEDELRLLVESAWSSNCAVCHGRTGQGDGPQGPMVKAPNLTEKGFQDGRTDEQLVAVIKNGRNKMPAFPSLPASVVTGLVARIRALRMQ